MPDDCGIVLTVQKCFSIADNNFDLPDRTFHSVHTTWRLASKESPTDVKELIPEFFCFPEMFENFEGLNFGVRQSGEPVYDVILPPWANHSSRLFVLIHRQALECDLVRQNLHKWIDLVFGYKQMGQEAIDAINVFHPAVSLLQPSSLRVVHTLWFVTDVHWFFDVRSFGSSGKNCLRNYGPNIRPNATSTPNITTPILVHS